MTHFSWDVLVVCVAVVGVVSHVVILSISHVLWMASYRLRVNAKLAFTRIALVPSIVLPFVNNVVAYVLTADGELRSVPGVDVGTGRYPRDDEAGVAIHWNGVANSLRTIRKRRILLGKLALIDLMILPALVGSAIILFRGSMHISRGDSLASLLRDFGGILFVVVALAGQLLCACQVAVTNLSSGRVLSAMKATDGIELQFDDRTLMTLHHCDLHFHHVPLMGKEFTVVRCVCNDSSILLTPAIPGVLDMVRAHSQTTRETGAG